MFSKPKACFHNLLERLNINTLENSTLSEVLESSALGEAFRPDRGAGTAKDMNIQRKGRMGQLSRLYKSSLTPRDK